MTLFTRSGSSRYRPLASFTTSARFVRGRLEIALESFALPLKGEEVELLEEAGSPEPEAGSPDPEAGGRETAGNSGAASKCSISAVGTST